MKATHIGSCQICGREQKLPSNAMSLHGYTVNWGFFNGTCTGSRYLPFEQSKNLIEEAIKNVTAQHARLTSQVADLRANTEPTHIQVSYYDRNTYRHIAATVEVSAVYPELSSWRAKVTDPHGREFTAHVAGYGPTTAEQAAHYSNTQLAAKLEREELESMKFYIEWQTLRIKEWTVRELKKVA